MTWIVLWFVMKNKWRWCVSMSTIYIIYLHYRVLYIYSMQGKEDGLRIERSGLHDNWDDAEGYYSKYWINLLSSLFIVIPLLIVPETFCALVFACVGPFRNISCFIPFSFMVYFLVNSEFILSLSHYSMNISSYSLVFMLAVRK